MKTRILCLTTILSAILCLSAFAYTPPFNSDPKSGAAQLQKALSKYYEVARKGGWHKIVLSRKYYTRGQSSEEIKQVKERLRMTGDFNSSDDSPLFTEELSSAIRKVQRSFGEVETGVIDNLLVKDLNVPVHERVEQLEVNLDRWQSMQEQSAGTHLIANIPEFRLHVYEGNDEVFNMAIIAGKEGKETVTFNNEMKYIVFSPYWNVPQSIINEEIHPAMSKDRNYLRNNGYEMASDGSIRQKPGAGNSLGLVKFVFPNNYGIYFHDTPYKSLFKLQTRTFSHGCIRLAEPAKLAEYLLRNSPGWTAEKIQSAMHSGKEQRVNLPKSVPVMITYYTAWVDDDGLVNFRDDIYGLDKEAAKKLMKTAKL